jgi:hypothetical protein
LLFFEGCNYSDPDPIDSSVDNLGPASLPALDREGARQAGSGPVRGQEERTAILEGSIILIEGAALQPGGDNFKEAVKKLNQYFEGTNPAEYRLNSAAREYLKPQLPPSVLAELENSNWSPLGDTRHLEDCMMYYKVATRVAGAGADLDKVRRVFAWVVRQVQLVPPGKLGVAELPHVYARPYDVLLRGMGTESEGFWSERAWVFMALCRQLGIDCGLITYSRNNVLDSPIPKNMANFELEAELLGLRIGPKPPVVWICAALIDDKAYLFDARLGLEVPGPGGAGVATLDQALADPAILERMNLPGLLPYGTSRASLLASRTKIGTLIDSSPGYFSPKMRLLEQQLVGKDRTILYRDPVEQRDHFMHVLGDRCGGVTLWGLPLEVEHRLFHDQQYVKSIQSSLFLFRPEFPLVYARVRQLRGETKEAIEDYVKFRFAENLPVVMNKRLRIPQEIQDGLDVFATYYLALAHLEGDHLDQAELMFRNLLELLPDPAPNQPYYNMLRWGASANLARIYESKKDLRRAVAHLTQPDPTAQYVGNLLRARELVWMDPMIGAASLPPAPPPKPKVPRPALPAKAGNAQAGR